MFTPISESLDPKIDTEALAAVSPVIDALRRSGLLDELIERLLEHINEAKVCSVWIDYLVSGCTYSSTYSLYIHIC